MLEKIISVDGYATRVLESGSGDPVVLIHGGDFGTSLGAHWWPPELFDSLAEAGYHAVAMDRLGHGQTDNPRRDEDYRMQAVVDHVIATIEAIQGPPATLVGWSRGGYIAARVALERPDLARGLVLVNSGSLSPTVDVEPRPGDATYEVYVVAMNDDARNNAEALSVTTEHITDALVAEDQRYYTAEKSVTARAIAADQRPAYFEAFRADKQDTLARIRAGESSLPVLIYWGVGDPTTTIGDATSSFQLFAGTGSPLRMHLVNNAGHASFREYPGDFTSELLRFLTDGGQGVR
jgi:pimeloyl-ACP methyl ester carboxylesterase